MELGRCGVVSEGPSQVGLPLPLPLPLLPPGGADGPPRPHSPPGPPRCSVSPSGPRSPLGAWPPSSLPLAPAPAGPPASGLLLGPLPAQTTSSCHAGPASFPPGPRVASLSWGHFHSANADRTVPSVSFTWGTTAFPPSPSIASHFGRAIPIQKVTVF